MQNVSIKRGDTFGFSNAITEDDGVTAITGIASELKCQIRNRNDELIEELTITESTETPGTYFFVAGDTSEWAIATYKMDIQRTSADTTTSTETILINIEKDVTV